MTPQILRMKYAIVAFVYDREINQTRELFVPHIDIPVLPAIVLLGMACGQLCRRISHFYTQSLARPGAAADLRLLGWALRQAFSPRPSAASPVQRLLPPFAMATVFTVIALRYGPGPLAAALMAACALLALLALIDTQTGLLPDAITLPLLGLGLFCAWRGVGLVPLHDAALGAAIGYGAMWILALGYRHARGRHGLGDGDIKLVAALAAWVSVPAILWVLMAASMAGILASLAQNRRLHADASLRFGPYLAGAGMAVMALWF
ncbi:leader peptidase (prepilin peptidase) / N-methyltransferase [Pollutimonas bauzanensis]|uniref:Leader peptidase (Prepilin peptidase) / N-methyltransferase n=2 Tax=Pollutimonas bauzanensis TaxID=658167 RepID=A0A1M5ZZE5_9BURK|nr:leader peptidase (prepilin peptidase) / N-methyltransferase [Pollutimonas bauzanensis]